MIEEGRWLPITGRLCLFARACWNLWQKLIMYSVQRAVRRLRRVDTRSRAVWLERTSGCNGGGGDDSMPRWMLPTVGGMIVKAVSMTITAEV